jgi:hypothetical protein
LSERGEKHNIQRVSTKEKKERKAYLNPNVLSKKNAGQVPMGVVKSSQPNA